MNNVTKIFGVKAIVYLKYSLSIEELAEKLGNILLLEFSLDTDPDPPHEIFGFSETLGFDISLNKSTLYEEFPFVIKIETELSFNESFNNEMFDISPWFARYISKTGKIETFILEEIEKKSDASSLQ